MPNMDKEDGELHGNGKLRDLGVVVEDIMVFDESHQAVKRGGTLRKFVREGPRVRYGREREVGIETQTGPVAHIRRSSRPRKGEFERAPSGFSRAHRRVREEQGLRESTLPELGLRLLSTNRKTKDRDE